MNTDKAKVRVVAPDLEWDEATKAAWRKVEAAVKAKADSYVAAMEAGWTEDASEAWFAALKAADYAALAWKVDWNKAQMLAEKKVKEKQT